MVMVGCGRWGAEEQVRSVMPVTQPRCVTGRSGCVLGPALRETSIHDLQHSLPLTYDRTNINAN